MKHAQTPESWNVERRWLERVPKVELHIHLEGAIPLNSLWQLIKKYGGDPEVPDQGALAERFVYRDFPHFLRLWQWKNRFLREYEDFSFMAKAVAEYLLRQGVCYAEVFFSPAEYSGHGLEPQGLAEAIRMGMDSVKDIRLNLVCDLVRDLGAARGMRTLEEIAEVGPTCGVVGIGIGGSEHEVPPEVFTEVFHRARDLGFRTSAHAGEAAGPASVWGALRSLEADRIGHGTRAQEDPELVAYLKDRSIPVELCPISNLKTGVITRLEDHPVRRYFELGLRLSINSDDPAMFGTSLVDELLALRRQLGFKRREIKQLTLQAAESSWLSEGERQTLTHEIGTHPVWAEADGQT